MRAAPSLGAWTNTQSGTRSSTRNWGAERRLQIKLTPTERGPSRHTHASQLIDTGVDIVTISKRLGHAKRDITLRIYAHLFQKDDSKAAAVINATLR